MKSNCFPLKDNGKEKIIKEKGNKKVKIIGYKELSIEDFAESKRKINYLILLSPKRRIKIYRFMRKLNLIRKQKSIIIIH